jgi:hypothetical protein
MHKTDTILLQHDQNVTSEKNNNKYIVKTKKIPTEEKNVSLCPGKEELVDLYNFVFNDTNDKNIDDLFATLNDDANKMPRDCDMLCAEQPKDDEKHLCYNEIHDHFINKQKKVKNSTSNSFTRDGKHPIIFEYESGEKKYNDDDTDLHAFESYESSYMSL